MKKLLTKCAISAIDFYRNCISRLMLPRCRFNPSCSVYAREAIQKKGLGPGLLMGIWRLLRCHPFSRSAYYDPVK